MIKVFAAISIFLLGVILISIDHGRGKGFRFTRGSSVTVASSRQRLGYSYQRLLQPLSILGPTGVAFPVEVSDDGGIIIGLPSSIDAPQMGTVRQLEPNPWEQISVLYGKKLEDDDKSGFQFGSSVAVSTDQKVLAVGDPSGHGRIFVYKNELNRGWHPLGTPLEGITGQFGVGTNVALSGDGMTLAFSSITRSGACEEVYVFDGSKWNQEYKAFISQKPRIGSITLSGDGKTMLVASDHPVELKVLQKQDSQWSVSASIDFPSAASFEDLHVSDDGAIIACRVDYESTSYLRVLQLKGDKYEASYLPIQIHGSLPQIRLSHDGEMIALGEPTYDHLRTGRVRVLTIDGAAVNLVQTIHGRTPLGKFGAQVAISPQKKAIAILETHASQSKSLDRKEELYVYEQFE